MGTHADGVFSVSSFFSFVSHKSGVARKWGFLWKIKAPPRALGFGWLVIHGSSLWTTFVEDMSL